MASNSDDNVSLPSSTHDEFLDDPDIVKSMEDDEVSLPSSVHDVSLPSSLEDHEILDELNNYDEDLDPDFVNAEDEHREFLDLFCKQCDISDSSRQVPLPLAAAGLVGKHDVAEFYSPPRIFPAARALPRISFSHPIAGGAGERGAVTAPRSRALAVGALGSGAVTFSGGR